MPYEILRCTVNTLFSDIRFSIRHMRKTPGMAFLAILTLALGVGANMAIFTVIESVLLRPLPYPDSSRMVVIGPPTEKPSFAATSWLNYEDVRKGTKALEQAGAYSEDIGVVKTPAGTTSVAAPHLTPNLFQLDGREADFRANVFRGGRRSDGPGCRDPLRGPLAR